MFAFSVALKANIIIEIQKKGVSCFEAFIQDSLESLDFFFF